MNQNLINDKPSKYMNPYLAGIGLGLVLLASFVIMGRGLGASGAFSTLIAAGTSVVAPEHAKSNEYFSEYLGSTLGETLKDWLLFEVIGVVIGGFISGLLAGRIKLKTDKGPNISNGKRYLFAFIGGGLMGVGAKIARGCTSGQALSGGASLAFGSWVFMMMVFAGGYMFAYFIRRQWR